MLLNAGRLVLGRVVFGAISSALGRVVFGPSCRQTPVCTTRSAFNSFTRVVVICSEPSNPIKCTQKKNYGVFLFDEFISARDWQNH